MRHLNWILRFTAVLSLGLLIAVGCGTSSEGPHGLSQPPGPAKFEVVLDAPLQAVAGAEVILRARAIAPRADGGFDPVVGASVEAALSAKAPVGHAARGLTAEDGWTTLRIAVPADAPNPCKLGVSVEARGERREAAWLLIVRRDVRLLLATDKPVYQPGQTVRLRAMALRATDLRPMTGEATFEARDGRGNLVMREPVVLTAYGTASCELPIAEAVNEGEWKVSVTAGGATAHRLVGVARYVLPKFKVEVKTEREAYRPGETVKGTVSAVYPYGEPVANATVALKWNRWGVAPGGASKTTTADGTASFEVALPVEADGRLSIEATVRDAAGQEQRAAAVRTVSGAGISLALVVPEERLVPGVENEFFVVARTAAGTPARCDVTFAGERRATDDHGVARFLFSPKRGVAPLTWMTVSAEDTSGNKGKLVDVVTHHPSPFAILARTASPTVRPGASVEIHISTARAGGTATAELLLDGAPLSTAVVSLATGVATATLPCPGTASGILEIRATRWTDGGDRQTSRRLVLVESAAALRVQIGAPRETLRPGADASVEFRTLGPDGHGVPSALGVSIVDESVLQLGEADETPLEAQLRLTALQREAGAAGSLVEKARTAVSTAAVLSAMVPGSSRTRVSSVKRAWRDKPEKLTRLLKLQGTAESWDSPWVVRDGDGYRFTEDYVQRLGDSGDAEVTRDALVDPWGRPMTAAMLEELGAPFDAASRLSFAYADMAAVVGKEMDAWVERHDVVLKGRFVPGAVRAIANAGVFKNHGNDPLGEEWTLDRLAEVDPALSVENLERLTIYRRRRAAREALVAKFPKDGLVPDGRGGWRFRDGLGRELDLNLKRPDGSEDTLESLASTDPGFFPGGIASQADRIGRERFYRILLAAIGDGALRPVPGPDGLMLPADLAGELARAGRLKPEEARDRFGVAYDPAILAKSEVRFLPALLVSAAVSERIRQIDAKHCEVLHQKLNLDESPQDAVEQLVKQGALEVCATLDPWGHAFRLVHGKNLRRALSCALLKQSDAVSAGPDGAFGTADDLVWDGILPETYPGVEEFVAPTDLRPLPRPARWGGPPAWIVQGSAIAYSSGLFEEESPGRRERFRSMREDMLESEIPYDAVSQTRVVEFPDAETWVEGLQHRSEIDKLRHEMALREGETRERGNPVGPETGFYGLFGPDNSRELRGIVEHLVGGNELDDFTVPPSPGSGGFFDGSVEIAQNAAIADVIGESGLFTNDQHARRAVRLRRLFPELLAWEPLLITDDAGLARLPVRIADSITTWRVRARGNTQNGLVGEGEGSICVFQPFFADLDLPPTVTQGDEVAVPAMAWNYSDSEKDVELRVEAGEGVALLDASAQSIRLAPGAAGSVRFRVRFDRPGRASFTVRASAGAAADATLRETDVVPDGWLVEDAINARLDKPLRTTIAIPADALPGSVTARARFMPGAISQVLEGLQGLVRLPHG
ncbi:MAG: MG2 domain-containing protein [Planctomycetota bacterium]